MARKKKETIVEPIIAKEIKKIEIGTLISKVTYPEYIVYNGETIRLSPRERLENINIAKLGKLPTGIVIRNIINKEN